MKIKQIIITLTPLAFANATTFELRQGSCKGTIRATHNQPQCYGFDSVDVISVYSVDQLTSITFFADKICKGKWVETLNYAPGASPSCKGIPTTAGSFQLSYSQPSKP